MSPDHLRAVRMTALVAGSGALLAAMLLFPDAPRPRDLLWSVGVAALIFALVVNRLLRKRLREEERGGPGAR